MKKNIVIGVDLGINGGISALEIDCEKKYPLVGSLPMPTFQKVINRKKRNVLDLNSLSSLFNSCFNIYNVDSLAMEFLSAFPGQSSQTGYSLGYSTGVFESIANIYSIPFYKYRANDWQKEMFKLFDCSNEKKDTKKNSIKLAKILYPNANFKKTERCKNDSDGMTDSVLIALYHIKKMKL